MPHRIGSAMVNVPFVLRALLTLFGTFAAHAAVAHNIGSWRGFASGDVAIRARVTRIVPYNQKSIVDAIGGRIDVPPMVLPDVDISVFAADRWSVTGQAGLVKTDITLRDTAYGDIDVGSVWSLPVSLAAQYHLPTKGRFKPFVGAGVVVSWYFGEKPADRYIHDFRVSTPPTPQIKAGFDYQLNDTWFATFEAKRLFTPTQTIENEGVTIRMSLDTVTVGAGMALRL
ncbi:OmpW/AlkL family protein [Sphingomonas sp. Leaf231]|uniref:OmpW/AlkL family protein n=1 Tax=Sphingomonas sp. Leaf231 TaxID=1736301 RepID=UPI00138F9714|nr:OmpW family protein [Sphingomonas sp. Leaf231]